MSIHSALTPQIISAHEFPRTTAIVDSAVGSVSPAIAPGIVAGIFSLRHPHLAFLYAKGQRRILPSPQSISIDTPFDLASLTKILVTASLTGILVDRGWLSWTTPVRSFFPVEGFDGIEIRHLLSHTAGFEAWRPFWKDLLARFGSNLASIPVAERQLEMRKILMQIKPEAKPGEKCVYSDVSALLMGFILEDALQMPLDQAASSLVWEPWGLKSFAYHRTDRAGALAVRDEVAATESCSWRGRVLQGQVHDDNCWAMGGYAGHAGVFGNASDVLLFAKRMMEGALSQNTTRQMWTRVLLPPGCERTLGWDTPSGPQPSCGKYFSTATVGHLGFTGVSLWIDLEEGIAVTLLTNRVHPSRDHNAIREFRPRFHDAIREDWRELCHSAT